MIIIIPTKDRPNELIKTIDVLASNIFFFKEVIIVDSSNLQIKKIIKEKIKNYNFNIRIIDSEPSTCIQRNIGFNFIKK